MIVLDVAPPWFRGAMKQVLGEVLDEALVPIIERLDKLTELATETARLSAIVRHSLFLMTIILIFLISLEL